MKKDQEERGEKILEQKVSEMELWDVYNATGKCNY